MKIDQIQATTLRFEYENGFTYAGGRCTARLTTIIEVFTDNGLVGIGTAYSYPPLIHSIVEHQLAPLLIGEDATDVEGLWEKMYRLTRWYGRKGAAMTAIGGLDTAFWDLRGKAAGAPIWKLLGGTSSKCPAYASGLLWEEDVTNLAKEASRHLDRGFLRMKMRLGRNQEYDRAALEAVVSVLEDDHDLLVDGSMRYDDKTSRAMAGDLAAAGVFWFEEPFEPESIAQYRRLKADCSVPLAAGENEFGVQGFAEIIREDCVDIVQPDASRCGGISEVRRVGELAEAAKLGVATHSWSDAIAIVANAHVVSALPTGVTVEVDQTGNPFVEQLLTNKFSVSHGQIELGDAPGLGIELDKGTVQELQIDPFAVPNGAYSDMVFGKAFLSPAGPYA